jgi:putative tryptophan/tyrosine transport system substrate-binding protein
MWRGKRSRWKSAGATLYERMVAELVDLKVDVLLAAGSPVALAAKKATGTIPIVIVASDPVGLGLVASLTRPGGNVTGLSVFNEETAASACSSSKSLCPGLHGLPHSGIR